jgi:predicted transposase YbfD/YdcC
VFDAVDEGHGRLVRRRVFLDPAAKDLEPLRGWPELSAVLAVETIRGVSGTGKVEAEARYFLTSCGDDPAVLARAIRRHWAIENALHWVLDVTFREDDSRVRDRTAARNLALLRKIALNLVARDRGSRTGTVKLPAAGLRWQAGTGSRAGCPCPSAPATPATGSRPRSSATRSGSTSVSR